MMEDDANNDVSSLQLPLALDFYSTNPSEGRARAAAESLRGRLRGDRHFRLTPEFNAALSSKSAGPAETAPAVTVVKKKLDWNRQQAALDNMFDKQLKAQLKDLPDIAMPDTLKNITLMDYQIQGIKWLVKKEKDASPAPFYKKVKENGKNLHLCEITQSSQAEPPEPIHGSILCDEVRTTSYTVLPRFGFISF